MYPVVHVLIFLFTTPSTSFSSSSSSFTFATIGIRLLKDSSYCMQGCTGCLYWQTARVFWTSTWLLDWRQTQECVYVSFWNLGQDQEYLLDLNTCPFVCLVLKEDVEASRPQNVLSFQEIPGKALNLCQRYCMMTVEAR